MWSPTTFVHIFIVNLLFSQTYAGRYDVRKRDFYTIQQNVVITEQVDVVVQPDGSTQTTPPTAVETMSYYGTPSLVVEVATATPIAPPPVTDGEQNQNDEPTPDDSGDDATPESPEAELGPTDASNTPPPTNDPVPTEDPTSDPPSQPSQPELGATPLPAPEEQPETTTKDTPLVEGEANVDSSQNDTPTIFPDIKPEILVPSNTSNKIGSNKQNTRAKRGVAYNDAQKLNAFSSSNKVSWAYNWGSTTSSIPQQYEFVPMLWGLGKFTDGWTAAADKALASGSTHILSFNEPDLGEQSSLTIPQAAEGYRRFIQPYAGKAKLGSPAVTNGGAPMGLAYLTGFMVACADCTIDFIAIHWYNGGNAQDFKEYVTKAHIVGGGRPVWITEFEASGDPAQQQAFLNDVLPWLDSQDFVERYAYFMASDGNLISSGTSLSTVGQAFAFD
ncbi:hypothetical protein K3495_g8365 [Podosphaera aphanis]|nr:hypothetical protein K3495_g8365 [Podosphaera aphanis]